MNALALWNPSDSGIIWGVNVLLQVSLVAAVALAVGAFLRRSSAMRLHGVTSKTHLNANVIARTSVSGIVWQKLDLGVDETVAKLTLPPQQLIEVRLVDIEGQPAVGLPLGVTSVIVAEAGKQPGDDLRFFPGLQNPPRAWPAPMMTDDRGRVTIQNISPGHGVLLYIPGTERFAPQHLALNTGWPEERGERDGTYRSFVKTWIKAKSPRFRSLRLNSSRASSGLAI